MDNTAYTKIAQKLTPFFETLKFNKVDSDEGEVFVNDAKAFKITYDEAKKQVTLSVADVLEKGIGSFSAMSSWLFDETSTDRDVNSIANDFEESARRVLGCKTNINGNGVEMPRASSGDSKTPNDIAQKLLAVFPDLKNEYATHITENNEFYYVEFFEEQAVPAICKLLDTGDKKKISKFIAALNELYVEGSKETTAIVAYTLLGGVAVADEKYEKLIFDYIAEYQYLKIVMPHVVKLVKKDVKKKK